jgi:UPF0271 protein
VNQTEQKYFILDTTAFIMGYDPSIIHAHQVTTPAVEAELISNAVIRLRLQLARETQKLELRTASRRFIQQVSETIQQTGDAGRLSDVDIELLAVALELHEQGQAVVIVSDDYSIQNVACQLQIEFTSLSTFGIRSQFQWINYCPGCYRKYPTKDTMVDCEYCGTRLKKKPQKKAD